MIGENVFLDYNSTTPVDPRVLDDMLPYFSKLYANPSSTHIFGLTLKESIELSIGQIAQLLNARLNEIVITSGATEAVNFALKGLATSTERKHIITVVTEHKSVLDTCDFLEKNGYEVTYLNVNSEGLVSIDEILSLIRPNTLMISVMLVNNETGVLQPVKEISKIAHQYGILFFCDATQAIGKIPVDVNELGVDLLAFSSHKFYGPKGVGGLFISEKIRKKVVPQIHGGGHQFNLRSGTLNVPGIIGLGRAAKIALEEMNSDKERIFELRNKFENYLMAIPDVSLNGHKSKRIYNTSNLHFSGVNSEKMIMALGNISVSNGAACSATTSKPSHVLKAMGLTDIDALSSIRFSLGKYTTENEIDIAVDKVEKVIKRLRAE